MRNIVSAAAAAALCMLSVQPAPAQDHRFTGFDAPRGATATVNIRVPLGERGRQAAPSYGVTLRHGRPVGPAAMDERGPRTRAVDLVDFRFVGGEFRNARLGAFDLAGPGRGERMNLSPSVEEKSVLFALLAAALLGVFLCSALCSSSGDSSSTPYTPPGE